MATNLLLVAGIVFVGLALAGSIAWYGRLSVIPAYLVLGILIGPAGPTVGGVSLSLVRPGEFIDLFAELGIVFLLFFIGVEFSVATLAAKPRRLLRAGGVDLVVNVALGVVLGLAFGFTLFESLFIAGIVYPSSSAVITKSLVDLGWIADPESEAIMGVLVTEDIVMAVYIAVLAGIAIGGAPEALLYHLGQAGVLLIALALLATVGRESLARVLDISSDELFLLRIVGITVFLGGAALSVGVSEAVAAFFVGAAVSETRHKDRIERVLAPARDLFAAVFFFAIGLGTDPRAVFDAGTLLVAAIGLGIVGKSLSGYLGGRAYDLAPRRSIRMALAMITRGEFSLVVAAVAATASGRLAAEIPAFAVGYVLIMSILGTILMRYSASFERRLTG